MNDWISLFTDNNLRHLLVAAGVFAVTFMLLSGARRLAVSRLERLAQNTARQWDDLLAAVVKATSKLALLMLALMLGLRMLEVAPALASLLSKGMVLVFILQIGLWAQAGITAWLARRERAGREHSDAQLQTNIAVIRLAVQFVLWTLVVLLLLDNLGFNITTLVASLGIGGVAVALAVQNILGDLFASLSITLDKPFLVGDSIVVDDLSGTVRHVGLKTTRIQSITGEEVVISNNDLLKSRIRNYKRMAERRIVFRFGLTYDTPTATLRDVPERIKAIVEAQPDTRFDRAHFAGLGDSSLDFEVVYHMTRPDYRLYMDTQQQINLALLEMAREIGTDFAFQTRTISINWPDALSRPPVSLGSPAGRAAAAGRDDADGDDGDERLTTDPPALRPRYS